ncbi:MAG TPA: sulfatase-like hydrolase/transferase [Woeseiaceae bacterium]|nr:sulfatase-like hydrolase/transferase [Woeseiaceae bacterium]
MSHYATTRITRPRLYAWQLALLAAAFITLTSNWELFGTLTHRLDLSSLAGAGFMLLIPLLIIFVLTTLFLLLGVGRVLKVIIAASLIVSAVLSYFINELGVVFDKDMFINVLDTITEGNTGEAFELLSWPLAWHVLLFGVVPALLLLLLRIRTTRPLLEFRNRATVIITGFALVTALALSNYRYTSYFAVENRDLRHQVVPVTPLIYAVKLARDSFENPAPFVVLGADAMQDKTVNKRTVGIMVVGETARADHFSLLDYTRRTNPRLALEDDLVSLDARACGTSTAYSVPCMFFLRGQEQYDPEDARAESNVLDVLAAAGVETIWIDNNSTCKHVCDRIESRNLRLRADGSMQFDGDYDSLLVDVTNQLLDRDGPDLLIVLHMMGSHGPAYSRRYPEKFATFEPYCHELSPTECSTSEVTNAYDNSILYTDYILDELIARLKQHRDDFDSFLFYASDHGESLGEDGVYLHGLPYQLAPRAQKEVPMLVWLSGDYAADHHIDLLDPSINTPQHASHDSISHTLLGLYDVRTNLYAANNDLFAAARSFTLAATR